MTSNYISSNDNRFYAAMEQAYGQAPAIAASNRFPAVKLKARQRREKVQRRDKCGGRTFIGMPAGLRKETTFELTTYMTGWSTPGQEPGYGPLFRAALGGGPQYFAGGTVQSASGTTLRFAANHGLAVNQAVKFGGEIRFVAALVDAQAIELSAPFTAAPQAGAPIGATVSYMPGTELESASIFDYWSPSTSVHRILSGAAVDKMRISINGDFHEFEFSGWARDLVDSASFEAGQAGLTAYPAEPAEAAFDYSIIPGHLGQAWLGSTPSQFLTLTAGSLELENDLEPRSREFGLEGMQGISTGMRSVNVGFSLFEQDDAVTKALYRAARQQSPITVMFQLGNTSGQLFGAYLKRVVPEVPEFDDGETRLEWKFQQCRAQGSLNDEIAIAFG
jgi:hypothetical protein